MPRLTASFALLWLAAACTTSGGSPPADTDIIETDPPIGDDTDDVNPPDTDVVDTDPVDTAPPVPLAGFGAISGDCGVLDAAEWGSTDPFLFRGDIDFGTAAFSASVLSPGGQQIMAEGTLGGSSGESEAVSFDLLYRCELADLLKSESTILYLDAGGKKTDILVEIDGVKVGVSVTRAMTFDFPNPCAPTVLEDLTDLLTRKVTDLPLSRANAEPVDRWDRSMLYVIACDDAHADHVADVFWSLDPSDRGDAILMVAGTEGDDAFLY
jgi:hypothetical protein